MVDIKHIATVECLKDFFRVGTIYTTATSATYRVTRIKDLMIIVAHFTNYPLISPKVMTYTL